MQIEWSERLATGITEIDLDHRRFIDRLNQLATAIAEQRGRQEVLPIVDYLDDHARTHFRREERYSDQRRCPAAEENRLATSSSSQSWSRSAASSMSQAPALPGQSRSRCGSCAGCSATWRRSTGSCTILRGEQALPPRPH